MPKNVNSGATTTVIIPHAAKWQQRLLSFCGVTVAKVVMLTWRAKWDDRSGAFDGKTSPVIFCVWHNRLALSMYIWRRFVSRKRPANGLAALISASKDGGLLADILKRFNVQPIRGSSSRRGRQALLEATTSIEKGLHVAITPDGPRGPKYEIQDGVLALAQLTGLPIIPVSVFISPKIQLKSWDNFQIPLPFAKCEIIFAQPVLVPRDASDEQREEIRKHLQRTMMDLTRD